MSTIASLPQRPVTSVKAPVTKASAPVSTETPATDDSVELSARKSKSDSADLKAYALGGVIGVTIGLPVLAGAVVGPLGALAGAAALTAFGAATHEDKSEYHDRPYPGMATFTGLATLGLVGSSFGVGVGLGAVALCGALGTGLIAALEHH